MTTILRTFLLAALAAAGPAHAAPPASAAASSAPPVEIWSLATQPEGRFKIIWRYIDDLGPRAGERATESDRVTLTWHFDAESNNGLPTLEEKDSMDALEDLLEPAVETVGFSNLALVRTGAGVREWTYYTRSSHEFLERMKAVLPGHPQFAGKVKVAVAAAPGWTAYEAFRRRIATKD